MAKCSYKTTLASGDEWECPCDSLPEEEFCYWHKVEVGKEPTQEMLGELKEKEIFDVYLIRAKLQNADLSDAKLQNADLNDAELRNANLIMAALQNAHLNGVELRNADLFGAKLQNADLNGAELQNANLSIAELQNANLFGAELQNANLGVAELQNANLSMAKLQNANLSMAKLRNANLFGAELQNADLNGAELQNADLRVAKLQNANLVEAKLQNAKLKAASLQGTLLYGVRFDSETALENSKLFDANLFRSYFDEAKSFRHAELFRTETGKEINEIIGDALGEKTKVWKKKSRFSSNLELSVLDIAKIKVEKPDVAAEILDKEGLAKYASDGTRIVFFDRSSGGLSKNPENGRRREDDMVIIDGLPDLIVKDEETQSEYLYDGSSADQFEASYEVYNNLYNFYVANGRLDKSAHVHYRREEVYRKLRWEKGGWMRLRSIFDLLILRSLTGYGDRIDRPIIFSVLIVGLFAALFKLTEGIVKNVNGEPVTTDWIDYVYHSITTFTSLGYSNIQPNLAVGHIPQILVAVESGLGVMMMALIIFVITYQISR